MSSDNNLLPTLIGTGLLGLLSWQMLTLQNLTKSVEVLANQIQNDGRRIDTIEQRLYSDYVQRRDHDSQ